VSGVALFEAHPDLTVNVIEGKATGKDTTKALTWVTDLDLPDLSAVRAIARPGRRRWGIENETFPTLKSATGGGTNFE